MHGKNYREIKGMAYTSKTFAPGAPNPKVARFSTGKARPDYDCVLTLVSDGRVQIRHNALEAARVADKAIFLYKGEIVEIGSPPGMFENPQKELTEKYISGRLT